MAKQFTHNGYTATYRLYSRNYQTYVLTGITAPDGAAVQYDEIFTGNNVGSSIKASEREVIKRTKQAINDGFPTRAERNAAPSVEIDLF